MEPTNPLKRASSSQDSSQLNKRPRSNSSLVNYVQSPAKTPPTPKLHNRVQSLNYEQLSKAAKAVLAAMPKLSNDKERAKSFLDVIQSQSLTVPLLYKMITDFRLIRFLPCMEWKALNDDDKAHFWNILCDVLEEKILADDTDEMLEAVILKMAPKSYEKWTQMLPLFVDDVLFAKLNKHFRLFLLKHQICVFNYDLTSYLLVPEDLKIRTTGGYATIYADNVAIHPSLTRAVKNYLKQAILESIEPSTLKESFQFILCAKSLGLETIFPLKEKNAIAKFFLSYLVDQSNLLRLANELYEMAGPVVFEAGDKLEIISIKDEGFWNAFVLINIVDGQSREFVLISRQDFQKDFKFEESIPTYKNEVELFLQEGYSFNDYRNLFTPIQLQSISRYDLNDLLKLLKLADFYQNQSLLQACAHALVRHLSEDTLDQVISELPTEVVKSQPKLHQHIESFLWEKVFPKFKEKDLSRLMSKEKALMTTCKLEKFYGPMEFECLGKYLGSCIETFHLPAIKHDLSQFTALQSVYLGHLEGKNAYTILNDLPSLHSLHCRVINLTTTSKLEKVVNLSIEYPRNKGVENLAAFSALKSLKAYAEDLNPQDQSLLTLHALTLLSAESNFQKIWTFVKNLQHLRTVHISHVPVDDSWRNEDTLFFSVEDLSIRFTDERNYGVLKVFPNLKRLHVDLGASSLSGFLRSLDRRPVLTHLSVRSGQADDPMFQLDMKYFWALQEVTIKSDAQINWQPFVSAPNLKKMIFDADVPGEELTDLILKTNLQLLGCKGNNVTQQLLLTAKRKGVELRLT